MVTAHRPSRPQSQRSVAKLVEELPFLPEVDQMLLESLPVSDVAKFIQEGKNELKDVNPRTLINVLTARRHQRQEKSGWWGAEPTTEVVGDDELREKLKGYRRMPLTPSGAIKSQKLYDRTESGIRDMIELEAVYLAKRDRADRLMELEALSGAFSDITTRALDSMDETLWKRIQARAKMNQGDGDDFSFNLNIRNYSQRTMEVMSRPESRHRIVSLMERLVRFGASRIPLPPVNLPLPRNPAEK